MPKAKNWIGGEIRVRTVVSRHGYEPRKPAVPHSKRARATILTDLDDDLDLRPMRVCAVGDELEVRDLTLGDKVVLADLLSMEETPEGCVAFATKWGLVGGVTSQSTTEASVDCFYEAKHQLLTAHRLGKSQGLKQLAEALTLPEHLVRGDPGSPFLGRAEIQVVRPRRGRPEIIWYVHTLRSFLWLELLLDVAGAARLIRCANPKCPKWHAQQSRGRARDYCSDTCRQAAWRAAHRDQINRERRENRRQRAAM